LIMERKIGEIFNIDNEWYQVVKSNGECCKGCAFYEKGCKAKYADVGSCGTSREDWTQVIFKKLEKFGEPITVKGRTFQKLILDDYSCANCVFNAQNKECYKNSYIEGLCSDNGIWVEIKQNKEDKEDLDKIKVRDYTKVEELNVMEENKLNLKPFDLQKAKLGKPVCTRGGRKARIICFDRKFYHDGYNYPIVAMVNDNDNELVHAYTQDGLLVGNKECDLDLMMLPEKKVGWAKVRKDINLYETKEEADRKMIGNDEYVTAKVFWEE